MRGIEIKAEREARGWSRQTMSIKLHEQGTPIDPGTIARIERGGPTKDITMAAIVAVLAADRGGDQGESRGRG